MISRFFRGKRWLLLIPAGILVLAAAAAAWYFFLHGGSGTSVVLKGTPSGEFSGQSAAVHVIDVGQADAVLLEQDGRYALIDTGTPAAADTITFYLDAHGVRTLDYLVLTHFHSDHIGSAVEILRNFKVKNVLLPDLSLAPAPTSATALDLLEELAERADTGKLETAVPAVGSEFPLGNAVLTVIGSGIPCPEDANNTSLMLLFRFDNFTYFCAGDAEDEAEAELLSRLGDNLHADLYKVSHHGSATSSSQPLIDALQPVMAAVSCGADNDYGHPHWTVLQRLQDAGVQIFRTDESGSLLFTVKNGILTARTEKRGLIP